MLCYSREKLHLEELLLNFHRENLLEIYLSGYIQTYLGVFYPHENAKIISKDVKSMSKKHVAI